MADPVELALEDYISEAQREAKFRYGKELTPEELGQKFVKYDPETRIQHLKNLRSDSSLSINEAAKRLSYERVLLNTHKALMAVKR